MAESARRPQYSLAEYLAFELHSNRRHEYLEGEIFAMAGGTPEHSGLCTNVTALLTAALAERPCRVFNSDLRVRVAATGLDTYPDASVVCGKVETDPQDRLALSNPVALVEVTSPSTAEYDRGTKLEHYQRIPSLRDLVLVAHDRREVEVWSRGSDGIWSKRRFGDGERVVVPGLQVELEVARVYHDPLASGPAA